MGWGRGGTLALAMATVVAGYCACTEVKEGSRAFYLRGEVDSQGAGFATALYQTAGVRMVPGNHLRWANNGAVFDVMAEEISRARSSINIVLFIWRPGQASERMLSVITERAQAGEAEAGGGGLPGALVPPTARGRGGRERDGGVLPRGPATRARDQG